MAFLLGMLVAGVGLYILALNLTPVAVWMLERSFPGARVEIRQMGFKKLGHLDVDSVVLKSRKDGETLLSLKGGSVEFNFRDLRNLQVGEVRLMQPVIHASPRLMDAFAPPPGAPEKKKGRPWSVRRLVCDYGELNVSDYGVSKLALQAKFAFDFQNFSPDSAPERVHEFMIWDASANLAEHPPFVTLVKGTMEFSFAELNNGDIQSIRLDQPVLHASPGLINTITAKPGTPSEKVGIPWNVKQLVCDYGEINIADYGSRGLWLRSKFAFDWKDFSPAKAPETVHKGVIWDFSAAMEGKQPFLTLDTVKLGFTFDKLLEERKLNEVSLRGGSLVVGDDLRKLVDSAAKEAKVAPVGPSQDPWIIEALDIRDLAVRIDDGRPEVTDLVFEINTTLQSLPLSQAASSLAAEGQLIEIANFEAVSPRDPLTKVLSVDSIFVRFTLEGLLRKEIKEFQIVGPTIYLGEDLFLYMDEMEKQLGLDKPEAQTTEAPNSAKSGWVIQMLVVRYGKLSIGSGGKTQYGLPLQFRAIAYDVALDNLAALQLRTSMEIPAQNYTFESYQLEFTSEKGQLRFAYPPEKQQNNVVGEIRLKNVRWRQYEATDSYLTVTFDRQGINGKFGGKMYNGQADGGFSFFFDSTSPWIGWCAGSRIDLRKLTNVISPQNFQMTGPMDFKLQMDAQGKNIDRILGEFQMNKPGKMKIGKLDDLLGRIPPTWNLLKQSSTKIALETLRDFEYIKGGGDFWFVQSQGILQLQLQGPLGSRNFDIVLHTNDAPEGRWKHDSTKR